MDKRATRHPDLPSRQQAAVIAVPFFAPLFELLPGMAFALDDEGCILAASEDGRRFLGSNLVDARAFLADFLLPDGEERLGAILARLRREAAGREALGLWVRRNDNVHRLLEGRIAKATLAQGVAVTIWMAVDITSLHQTTEQYLEMLEGLSQGVIVHRGGRPLFCNTALADLIGMSNRESVLSEPSIIPYIHPEDLAMVMANIQARLKGEPAPRDYQFRLVGGDGKVTWVDCRSSVISWDGEPAILACCFDINDHKWVEAAQRRSEELFSRVFHASPDFMIITRVEDGVHLDVNESYQKFFGFTRDEVIGRRSTEIGVWVDPEGRAQLLERLMAEGTLRDAEFQFRAKNGTIKDVQISADIITFGNQHLLLVIGRDIAERKRQKSELIASKEAADLANRTKSEFLANMSHELRTPLNAVLGFSEIIRNQINGPIGEPKYIEYANDIHASGTHLLEIINDILDLSKVEAGRLEIHEAALSLDEVLTNCLRLIRPRLRDGGLNLVCDLPVDLPSIIADERLLKQILLNLLSNAIKFTPKGGEVSVSARITDNGDFEVTVADTGIGMDAEGLAKAKTPFGQVDSSLSRKHEGTGLGLPLVIAFTERQGGQVLIDSAVCKGTAVTIRFPAAKVVAS